MLQGFLLLLLNSPIVYVPQSVIRGGTISLYCGTIRPAHGIKRENHNTPGTQLALSRIDRLLPDCVSPPAFRLVDTMLLPGRLAGVAMPTRRQLHQLMRMVTAGDAL